MRPDGSSDAILHHHDDAAVDADLATGWQRIQRAKRRAVQRRWRLGRCACGPIRSIEPRFGRLATCDQSYRGSVRYVMVCLVAAIYTDSIERG